MIIFNILISGSYLILIGLKQKRLYPIIQQKKPKLNTDVPISLWFVDKNHLSVHKDILVFTWERLDQCVSSSSWLLEILQLFNFGWDWERLDNTDFRDCKLMVLQLRSSTRWQFLNLFIKNFLTYLKDLSILTT